MRVLFRVQRDQIFFGEDKSINDNIIDTMMGALLVGFKGEQKDLTSREDRTNPHNLHSNVSLYSIMMD